MKRLLLLISISLLLSAELSAMHITGGEIFYTYLGQDGSGNYQYSVTLKLFRRCGSVGAPLDPAAAIGIYDKTTNTLVWSGNIDKTTTETLQLQSPGPCISGAPSVCYEVGYYIFAVSLPASSGGYYVTYQRCCRIDGISNLNTNAVGATYTADIPGTVPLATAPANNSAHFIGPDTVLVCGGYPFTYSFAASDPDGDQLQYSFCGAYSFSNAGAGNAQPNPPGPPPYPPVPYSSPTYNSFSPLGNGVTINSNTGLITGIAPQSGIYVVTVCVNEIRNGVVIATQRKDLQILAGDCQVAKAQLYPQYISCDGFSLGFANLFNSPLINSYFWDFGVTSQTNDTANIAAPNFTYPDTGIYIVKLVTNRNQECSDSTTAIVKVYPGFFPGFVSSGICVNKPTLFTDTTKTVYGFVNTWSWSFDDANSFADTSHLQNPIWTYSSPGPKNVQFIVTNSKGCIDTVYQAVGIIDKPPITLAFRDTLICVPDAVQLNASGSGVFSWTPALSIINSNTATPIVNPAATTLYYVNLDDNGCLNRDSVKVRVISTVSVAAINDTTICGGDPAQLGAVTNGLTFSWTPSATINSPNLLNPIATPLSTTTYQLQSSVGSCSATDNMTVFVVPYPGSNAGPDVTICYNTSAQLNASIVGSSFSWSPVSSLSSGSILNPVAYPPRTTTYVLTVYDTIGCPKPGRDTVIVTVLPKMHPFAGHDTTVVVGQPLQFNASGGDTYTWIPPTYLSDPSIPDPIGIYGPEIDLIKYKLLVTNQAGCLDSAFVTVKIFKTNPYVFVPTAFTPNGDGLNDVIRPIAVGIEKIEYFSIYNRWGQMVFSTTINGQGWDGKIGSRPQNSGVYVWMVKAIDYLGKPLFLKGTVALIR